MSGNMVLVAIGAAFGVLARVLSSNWIKRNNTSSFPVATFFVNMCGTLILGVVTGFGLTESFSLMIGTGFLGSFTTFSTFNIENFELLKRKRYGHLLTYLGSSYLFGILFLFTGVFFGTHMQ